MNEESDYEKHHNRKTMKAINRDLIAYLQTLNPKKIREYEENGKVISVYEAR